MAPGKFNHLVSSAAGCAVYAEMHELVGRHIVFQRQATHVGRDVH